MTAAPTETPAADNFWAGADIIHSYTRAQALADGELVDVTETAKEAGFRHPVAMTRAAHADLVAWNDKNAAYQDESGRLWDVLFMGLMAIKRGAQPDNSNTITYGMIRIPNTPNAHEPRNVQVRLNIGPGDNAEPVMTIMLTNED